MLDLNIEHAEGTHPDLVNVVESIHVPDLDCSALGVSRDNAQADGKNIFVKQQRQAWDKTMEARCDFTYRLRLVPRAGIVFISIWQKSLMGRTLTEIKADEEEVPHFARSIAPVIRQVLGDHLKDGGWCICTSPKRRHTVKNFASMVTEQIADMLGIPFYEDVACCKSKHRVNAVFTMNNLPKEPNIIVFDDFVTTGSTLKSMSELLKQYDKNFIFFSGVNNVFGKETT